MTTKAPLSILLLMVFGISGVHSVRAQDCQPNGLPDACDIDCGPPGDVCNIPGCGGSTDCNGNGIPDECEPQIACWTGDVGDNLWGNPANWQPPIVPNDPTIQVFIVGPAFVILDVTADIGGLVLLDGATLDAANTGDLNIGPGGLQAAGVVADSTILLGNNRTISTAGDAIIGPGAIIQPMPGVAQTDTATFNAGNLIIQQGSTPGEVRVQGSMRLAVQGDMVFNGSNVAGNAVVLGGLTEPILGVFEGATAEVEGNVQINGIAQIDVQSSSPPAPPGSPQPAGPGSAVLRIGGNFVNTSTRPDLFDLGTGVVILDGATPQTFEVAGRVQSTRAAMLSNNFEIGELRIEPGADVTFVDTFDNSQASAEQESQIVSLLVLSAGSSVTVDAAGLVYDTCINQGVAADVINFGLFASISQLITPAAGVWALGFLVLATLAAGTIGVARTRRNEAVGSGRESN